MWRYSRRRMIAYFLLVAGFAIAAVVLEGGEVFWWLVVLLVATFAFRGYRYFQTATKVIDDMPDRRVTVRFEPESITFQTSEALATYKWSRIKRLWRFPDVLLLFTYSQFGYSILPVASLGDDLQRFIELRVRENGGEVA